MSERQVIHVALSRDEMIFAAVGAVVRNIDALLKGRRTYFGDPWRDLWAANVTGALGECAVAKHYGRYWTPCYDDPSGVVDVGTRGQVRSTTNQNTGLRLYPRDRDDEAFIQVLVRAPDCYLAGWVWGHEGKRDEWARDGGWEVPLAELRSLTATAVAA